MARLLAGTILGVVLTRATTQLCNPPSVNACILAANSTLYNAIGLPGIPPQLGPDGKPDKSALCAAQTALESCIVANGTGCDLSDTQRFMQERESFRIGLTGRLGVECLSGIKQGPAVTLSSGDSGSTSGSEASASSGSAYGLLVWQWILLICCCVACCAGGGGGGAYAYQNMNKKKPKGGGKKAVRAEEYDQEEPLNVDVEEPQTVPPQMMPVYTEPVTTEVAQVSAYEPVTVAPAAPVSNVQPELFGPVPQIGLLPGATGSTIVPAAQGYATYTQPSYSYAQPQTYVQYAGTQSYTVDATPQMISNYQAYGGQPTYVTTSYAEQGGADTI